MRPEDHPQFFQFPAPEGRSRESTIVLHSAGYFSHDGERIENPAMERAFFRWLRRHPDDDRFILSNGYDWTYLTVEALPFFVPTLRLRHAPRPGIDLLVCDGTEEELRPGTLEVGAENALSCELLRGERARLSTQAQHQLGELLEQEDEGTWRLRLGDEVIALPQLA